ncbi:YncE family protein [Pseudomonas cavernicola]|uniref:YncE family protein n=1 Tax=Pseudomonas cavernicola TaxID=2320866 RepID=A0A418XBW1_9PSED|nr:YncE family protein [Pseudomonas cavernicola]RJG09981.1 YncE family protein [Pseudomonas cavernicola]
MKIFVRTLLLTAMVLSASQAQAEILALLNYETKPEQIMRKEGLAVVDVDPKSPSFGKLLMEIPLPPDLVAHHIYFNRDKSKAYITALGKSVLHVMDLTRFPYRMKAVPVPDCQVLEDVVFSENSRTWYLTCMGSSNVVMGDAATDKPIKTIGSPAGGPAFIKYPHGISIHNGIDRVMITSTVRPSDLGDPGETVTVLEASTGKVLSTHKVSRKPSPSGEAPVEVMFMPGATPPVAYITNMYGGTLWMAAWNPATKGFGFSQVDDYGSRNHGVALEMEHTKKRDRLYVTTAKPGHVSVYDVSDPQKPKFLKAIPAAAGAHHLAFSPDERYLFVQNSLLNLPGMSDGSITVIDVAEGKPIASMDTLKNMGLNPNCIVLLPQRP